MKEPTEILKLDVDCDTKACVSARLTLENLRNLIEIICGQISHLRREFAQNTWQQMMALAAMAVLMAMAMVMLIVATALPALEAMVLILMVMAMIAFTVMLFYAALNVIVRNKIRKLQENLAEAQADFQAAVGRVIEDCPKPCLEGIDLSIPSC